MGFYWIFMLIMSLVMPFLLIGFGWWFQEHPPKEINSIYGYRTKMSMKNMETWNYAHEYCGKLWFRIGWATLVVTILSMFLLIGKDDDVVSIGGALLMVGQCIILVLPVIWTEQELRRRFDADGERKKI